MEVRWPSTVKPCTVNPDGRKQERLKEKDAWLVVTGIRGHTGKGGDGVLFGGAGTAVPPLHCGGQGQVMHAREIIGPQGMACALRSPGVQGSVAATLNQNRLLPFECLEGRRRGGQINTKVGSGVPTWVTPVPSMWKCVSLRSLPLVPSTFMIFTFLTWLYLKLVSLSSINNSQTPSVQPAPLWQVPMYDLRNEVRRKPGMAQRAAIPRGSQRTLSHSAHCSSVQPFYPAAARALPSSPFITTPGVTTGQRLKSFRKPESM